TRPRTRAGPWACGPPRLGRRARSRSRPASALQSACAWKERPCGRRQLRAIIATREQMPVHIRRHLDRGVAEPCLHHLQRQFEAPVGAPVDAPRSIEVAQAMQAAVFRAAVPIDDTGGNLCRTKTALDDAVAMIDAALAVGEGEAEF